MPTRLLAGLKSFAPVPLRMLLGFGFVYHGYPKLFTAEGNDAFVGMLQAMGAPVPGLSSYLIGGFEFFGGILLLLGVAVRLVSALGIVDMIVAALTVHWYSGFNAINVIGTTSDGGLEFGMPGFEVNVLYIAGFASLLLSGAGGLSPSSIRAPGNVEEPATVSEPELTRETI